MNTSKNFENRHVSIIKNIHNRINSLKSILKIHKDKNFDIKINKSNSTLSYPNSYKKLINNLEDLRIDNYNRKDTGFITTTNIIKENKLELETSDFHDYLSERENKTTNSVVDNFIQQSQAEVKIKQKIMGLYYDIYLLNNFIKEKEIKNQNVSDDKKKLKSLKKILNKNIQCLNEISQKNQMIYSRYIKDNEPNMPKKDGNIYENDNDSIEADDLNETEKRNIYLISKICKLQKENIEVKYNYLLIKD